METKYYKWFSPHLNREMEMQSYGHGGKPALFIPCQDGRFFDFQNFKMTDVMRDQLENGQIKVYSIDTIDKETFSDTEAHPGHRIWLHEQWIKYITEEVMPLIRQENNDQGALVFGFSLGATHAVNLYYRRPDLFDRLMALSGLYFISYGFQYYVDGLVYENAPEMYLANMPQDHPYINMYNSQRSVICVGQGAWEQPESTRNLDRILKEKGINTWVDYWGYDCNHDWDWWYKQTTYFLPYLLG